MLKIDIKTALMLLVAIIFLQFYQPAFLPKSAVKAVFLLAIPLMVVYVNRLWLKKTDDEIFNVVRLICLSNVFSFFMAFFFWNQSFLASYTAMSTMFAILFYFFLCKKNPSISTVELMIVIFAVLYAILWLYAVKRAPAITFGYVGKDELIDFSRGFVRVNFVGSVFLVLGFFLSVHKFFQKRNPLFLVLAIFLFVVTVFQLTRQVILWTSVVFCLYLFSVWKKNVGLFLLVIVLLVVLIPNFVDVSDNSVLGKMLTRTIDQQNSFAYNNDYIRVREYYFFFTGWTDNIITFLFGNGYPQEGTEYGNFYTNILNHDGFYLNDVGYARMYVVNGVVGLFLYLKLFFICARKKVQDDCMYAKLFMIYCIPANVMVASYSSLGGQLAMAMCLYIYSKQQVSNSEIIRNVRT